MVQIWFGNTYLSFSQAESFHKLFGPILMTVFAALSNTLLLTSKLEFLLREDLSLSQEFSPHFYTFEHVCSDWRGTIGLSL